MVTWSEDLGVLPSQLYRMDPKDRPGSKDFSPFRCN